MSERLIDAESLMRSLTALERRFQSDASVGVLGMVYNTVARAPTVDAEHLKRGFWRWDENGYDRNTPAWVCSECGAVNSNIPVYMQGRRVANPHQWHGAKYCPNCGAKMEKMEEPEQ